MQVTRFWMTLAMLALWGAACSFPKKNPVFQANHAGFAQEMTVPTQDGGLLRVYAARGKASKTMGGFGVEKCMPSAEGLVCQDLEVRIPPR